MGLKHGAPPCYDALARTLRVAEQGGKGVTSPKVAEGLCSPKILPAWIHMRDYLVLCLVSRLV